MSATTQKGLVAMSEVEVSQNQKKQARKEEPTKGERAGMSPEEFEEMLRGIDRVAGSQGSLFWKVARYCMYALIPTVVAFVLVEIYVAPIITMILRKFGW